MNVHVAEQAPAADPLDTAAIAGHKVISVTLKSHYWELGFTPGREKKWNQAER